MDLASKGEGARDLAREFVAPALLCAFLFILPLALAVGLSHKEAADAQAQARAQGVALASFVRNDVASRVSALGHYAQFAEDGTRNSVLKAVASAYQSKPQSVFSVEWIEPGARPDWMGTDDAPADFVDQEDEKGSSPAKALARAQKTGLETISVPFARANGELGMALFFPAYNDGQYLGCLSTTFFLTKYFDYASSAQNAAIDPDSFAVSVLIDGSRVFSNQPEPQTEGLRAEGAGSDERANFSIGGHEVRIIALPTRSYLRASQSPYPILILVLGCVFSALGAIASIMTRRARAARRGEETAKTELIAERDRNALALGELSRNLDRAQWAASSARMGIWSWDMERKELSWSEQMFDVLDIPKTTAVTIDLWKNRIHPDDVARVEARLLDTARGTGEYDCEYRSFATDGSIRTIHARGRAELNEKGEPIELRGLSWDVTDARVTEQKLSRVAERVTLLLNSTEEAILGVDIEGLCTFANTACARMLAYPSPESLLGKDFLASFGKMDDGAVSSDALGIRRTIRTGKASHGYDVRLVRADGSHFPVECWAYPQISDGALVGVVVTFLDVTERRQNEERIRHMATHDSLTDLPSLRLGRDRVAMALGSAHRNGKYAAVLFVDLDGFKTINDTWGHDVGDRVLRETARRLAASVRATDTAARVGGDEFLLVLTDLDAPENAAIVAEKAIASLLHPISVNGKTVVVGASIGISVYPIDGETVDKLIKQADEAMYEVKRRGKNGFGFSSEMDIGNDGFDATER